MCIRCVLLKFAKVQCSKRFKAIVRRVVVLHLDAFSKSDPDMVALLGDDAGVGRGAVQVGLAGGRRLG